MRGTDDPPVDDDTNERAAPSSSLSELAESIRERQGKLRSEDGSGSKAERAFDRVDIPDTERDLLEGLDDASGVLVLGPVRGAICNEHCVRLLSRTSLNRTNVVSVTVTRSANDWIRMWQQYGPGSPVGMAVITLGEDTRGRDASTKISIQGGPDSITIETVSDPSDLTRLGITLNRVLSEITTSGERTAVCVHSLTSLLQYGEARQLFRFLHILQGKLKSLGAVAHYHLDPKAHDDQTVGVFKSLFDTVVRITDDGDLEVVSSPG